MKKLGHPTPLSHGEKKAAQTSRRSKSVTSDESTVRAEKTARLKELRLARATDGEALRPDELKAENNG